MLLAIGALTGLGGALIRWTLREDVATAEEALAREPLDGLAVAFLIDQQANLLVVTVLGLFSSAVAAALLATGFRRPIRELVTGARRLEAARYDTRLPVLRRDELGELAVAFNHLAARLE